MRTLDLIPNDAEIVTPEHFLQILAEEPENIAHVEVLPGQLGSPYLGGLIVVKRKKPLYQRRFGGSYGTVSTAERTNFFAEFGRFISRFA